MYADGGDEIHADLITKEHYEEIVKAVEEGDDEGATEIALSTAPLKRWHSQTMCHEPWPYGDTEILGTVHIWFV